MLTGLTTADKVNIAVAIASGLVALGTLFLSLKTRTMAAQTKRMAKQTKRVAQATEDLAKHGADEVEAARRLADGARKQTEALTRPWLTALVTEEWREPQVNLNDPGISLWVRNVGQGLALITPEQCRMHEDSPTESAPPTFGSLGIAKPAAIPYGEATNLIFVVEGVAVGHPVARELVAERPERDLPFLIDIRYTDSAGGQATWARLHMLRGITGGLSVTRIDYLRDSDGRPSVPAFLASEIDPV